ncbi:MAG: hypothetical protein A4E72_01670 [Syntrophus sp. PtaU1.Bin208]|nr:MAG: hypothetical protein A4E72_01670 [Syntrophus sp. PtaU1.Bin208]
MEVRVKFSSRAAMLLSMRRASPTRVNAGCSAVEAASVRVLVAFRETAESAEGMSGGSGWGPRLASPNREAPTPPASFEIEVSFNSGAGSGPGKGFTRTGGSLSSSGMRITGLSSSSSHHLRSGGQKQFSRSTSKISTFTKGTGQMFVTPSDSLTLRT